VNPIHCKILGIPMRLNNRLINSLTPQAYIFLESVASFLPKHSSRLNQVTGLLMLQIVNFVIDRSKPALFCNGRQNFAVFIFCISQLVQ